MRKNLLSHRAEVDESKSLGRNAGRLHAWRPLRHFPDSEADPLLRSGSEQSLQIRDRSMALQCQTFSDRRVALSTTFGYAQAIVERGLGTIVDDMHDSSVL